MNDVENVKQSLSLPFLLENEHFYKMQRCGRMHCHKTSLRPGAQEGPKKEIDIYMDNEKIYSFSISLNKVYSSSCFTALANYWEQEETSPMAKLFFNYPLWDFSCFPLGHLLLASLIASATKSALFNKMAASRVGFTECQLELLTLVSGAFFIQTGLDSTINKLR